MSRGPSLASLAWRNLWRNRRRTLITLFGIAFGLFLSIIFTGLGDSSYADLIDYGSRMGGGHVAVQHEEFLDSPSLKHTVPDAEELVAVAWGPRAFDAAPSATLTLVKTALTDGTLARLPVDDRALLVRKVLQRQPFSDLAGSTPPAPLMRRFRAALRALIRLAAPALVPASDPGAD